MSDPYNVVRDFEAALSEFTGAPFVVTTTSCTFALLLALRYERTHRIDPPKRIEIPKFTYIGVGMSVLHSGFGVTFRDEDWAGEYRLNPTRVWDSARRFTSGMFRHGMMQCVSFHWSKILGIGQAGAILHDDEQADEWLRRARFDGRTEGVHPKDDRPDFAGYHAYLTPRDAAEGLSRLAVLPRKNADIPWDDYGDLSQLEIFK